MIIHITQNDQEVYDVSPGTPVHLFAGAMSLWSKKTRFVVKNQANGVKVLDTMVGINMAFNAGMDWTAPTTPGTYYFFPDYDNSNDFGLFEVTAAATIPGTGGGYTPDPGGGYNPPYNPPATTNPDTGGSGGSGSTTGNGDNTSGQLPSWAIPVGIGLVAVILLLPSGKK